MKPWKKIAAAVGTVLGATTAIVGIAPGAAYALPGCSYGRDLRTEPRTGTLTNGVLSLLVCGDTKRTKINQMTVEYKRVGGSGTAQIAFTWEGISRDGKKSYQREPKPAAYAIRVGETVGKTWTYPDPNATPFEQYAGYPCVRGIMISNNVRYVTEMECR